MSVAEHNGVGRVGHREEEGVGGAQRGGDQDVERVHVDGLCLETDAHDGNDVTWSQSEAQPGPTRAERMGRKMVMVAALLVTSVTVVTMIHATVMVANTGRLPRGSRSSATHRDRPDTYTRTHTTWIRT